MDRRIPILLAAFAASGPGFAQDSAEAGAMRAWLDARYEEAYVSVQDQGAGGLATVVHVLPRDPERTEAAAEASGIVDALKGEALGDRDFAPGSQFLVFGRDQFSIQGTGKELEKTVRKLAREVVALTGELGLGALRVGATGYSGPMVSLELHARGIDLGEARRADLEKELKLRIRDRVFGRYGWIAFLENQSRIRVIDQPLGSRPPEERPPPTFAELADPFGPTRLVPAFPDDPDPFGAAVIPEGRPPSTTEPGPALATVYFDTDRSELRPQGISMLRSLIEGRDPSVAAAVIVGHTDSRNTEAYNHALGQRRADSVARYLAEQGVPPERIQSHTHGETDPAAPNDSPENMQRNRRAHVQVLD